MNTDRVKFVAAQVDALEDAGERLKRSAEGGIVAFNHFLADLTKIAVAAAREGLKD